MALEGNETLSRKLFSAAGARRPGRLGGQPGAAAGAGLTGPARARTRRRAHDTRGPLARAQTAARAHARGPPTTMGTRASGCPPGRPARRVRPGTGAPCRERRDRRVQAGPGPILAPPPVSCALVERSVGDNCSSAEPRPARPASGARARASRRSARGREQPTYLVGVRARPGCVADRGCALSARAAWPGPPRRVPGGVGQPQVCRGLPHDARGCPRPSRWHACQRPHTSSVVCRWVRRFEEARDRRRRQGAGEEARAAGELR